MLFCSCMFMGLVALVLLREFSLSSFEGIFFEFCPGGPLKKVCANLKLDNYLYLFFCFIRTGRSPTHAKQTIYVVIKKQTLYAAQGAVMLLVFVSSIMCWRCSRCSTCFGDTLFLFNRLYCPFKRLFYLNNA